MIMTVAEPLLLVVAFFIAWDYCQPAPLLVSLRDPEKTPVTLEDQRTAEWLAAIRPPILAPHTGHRAKRKAETGYTPRHYSRD
jgi:hypothetical protein